MLAHAKRIVDTQKEVVGLQVRNNTRTPPLAVKQFNPPPDTILQDDLATMVQQSAPGLAMLVRRPRGPF